MADMNFTVDANTNPAIRNLDKLTKKVDGLTGTFDKLKTTLAGLAFGVAINNAIKYADAIQDISTATGIATQNILGFNQAVVLSGGDSEKAQQSLLKFVTTVGEAVEGGKSAQSAFAQVGVTLRDLATLSEQDLLEKTIQGLAGIDDASQRLKLAQELLGKAARGIDWNNVANSYGKATEESRKFADSVRAAAELQDKLDRAFTRVNLAILKALEPLAKFVEKLTDEQINNFIDALVKIAGLAAGILATGKAIELVAKAAAGLGTAFALWKVGTATASAGLVLLIANLKTVGNILKNVAMLWAIPFTTLAGVIGRVVTTITGLIGGISTLGTAFAAIGAGLLRMIPLVAAVSAALYGLNEVFRLITGNSLVEWIGKGIDKLKEFIGLKSQIAGPDQSDAETQRLQRQNKALENQAKVLRDVTDANEKLRNSILDTTKEYRDRNAEFQKGLEDQLKGMSMSEEQIALQQALDDINKRANDTIEQLIKQKRDLADSEKSLIPLIDAEIAKIKGSVNAQEQAATTTLAAIEQRRLAQEKLNLELEKTRTAAQNSESLTQLQEQLNLVGMYGDKLQNNLVKLDVERELRGKLNDLALKQIELENNRAKLGEARFQQEMAQLEALRQAAVGYATARLEAENKIVAATRKAEREDIAGALGKRLEEIQRSVDPTVLAVQKVDSVFGNMGRAIDDFVQTGKFKFKDFTMSIIKDLIAIELKAQATKFLSSVLGNAGSFLGSLLGFANGGNPPVNKPSIVGERGPELFVPKTAGTIVPNGQLGQGMGPVNNTYITNNISALDAKSVAQLFAENRKTLLGTVRMAEKELPYGNR